MLEVRAVDVGYGPVAVLKGFSLQAHPGEIHCLLGRNGAGKTTAMKAIMGLLCPTAGRVEHDGAVISDLAAHMVPRRGIGYVPQGRRLWGELTVAENLALGLMTRSSPASVRDEVLALFPALAPRLDQRADTLSGGEQTMLSVGRALCLQPSVLLLDEPTEGLQPSMIAAIRDVIVRLRAEGKAIVLVEQRIEAVLAVADRVSFVENGRNAETLGGDALRADPGLLHRRLGV